MEFLSFPKVHDSFCTDAPCICDTLAIVRATERKLTMLTMATAIEERFTPFAFRCKCDGKDNDCAESRRNPSTIVHNDTVQRIAAYLRK